MRGLILYGFFIMSVCSGLVVAQEDDEEDFLQPEQAFSLSVTVDRPDQISAVWDVAEDYYLYKNKFSFSTDTPGIKLIKVELPAGKIKQDEFFGDVEVLRGKVVAKITLQRAPGSSDIFELKTRSQGCADAGLCYPPQRENIQVSLPPMPQSNFSFPMPLMNPADVLNSFGRGVGIISDNDEILPADQAFIFNAVMMDAGALKLDWLIAPGTYLYRDQIELSLIDSKGVSLGQYQLPKAKIKQNAIRPDGSIGEVAVYEKDFSVILPLLHSTADAKSITLLAKYQGCAEIGICYPPRKSQMSFDLPAPAAAEVQQSMVDMTPDIATQSSVGTATTLAKSGGAVSEQDRIVDALKGDSLWLMVLTFFGFGVLLSLTPCIFPMIPILSGIIAGQKNITARKSFLLSVVFVLAMAMTYAVAGILAAVFGQNLQIAFQNPWVLSTFVVVFVALAMSMFGFYELQLPSSLQSKMSDVSNQQKGGSLIGVGVMGALSALIIGPCVAPPLAGALIYVGQTGDWVMGGLALFFMAIGMGLPLLLIGASAGKLLPKAGAWMETIKAFFGVGLLAVAIILLERLVPPAVAMLLWGILMVVSGVYMGAFRQLAEGISGWFQLWKGLGVVLVIYGALMLVGVAVGGKDTIQPLRGLGFSSAGVGGAATHLQFKRIKTLADLQREVAEAGGRPVMLDFYADWCVSCKEMERYTFSDPKVLAALSNFVLLQADVTADDADDKALLQGHFGYPGPPAIIFYGADGVERSDYRVVGYMDADRFAAHIQEAMK